MNWTDKIQVFREDCKEVMKRYPDNYFDLAIVDPPYGIGVNKMQLGDGRFKKQAKTWDDNKPTKKYWDELYRISENQIVFGANYFDNIPLESGIIFWYKRAYLKGVGQGEIAWTSFGGSIKVLDFTYIGNIKGFKNPKPDYNMRRIHPTQKPIEVYKWLLENYAKEGDKIFDSHFGSGSIAVACHDLKFDLVGCEIDQEYYDLSYKRFKDHAAQLQIF